MREKLCYGLSTEFIARMVGFGCYRERLFGGAILLPQIWRDDMKGTHRGLDGICGETWGLYG